MSSEPKQTIRQKIAEMIGGKADATNPEHRQKVSTEEKAEIEQLLTEGYTPNEIADIIGRPYKTVFSHISAVRRLRGQLQHTSTNTDPLRDNRLELERIKLDTQKLQLEHTQRIQELELKAKLAETELKGKIAELDYKAKLAELEGEGDEEEDDGFNPEQLLMQILQMGKTPAANGGAVVEVPTVPKDVPKSASIEQAKEAVKRHTSPPAGDSKPTLSPAQKKQLAAYIKKQAYTEDETVELAAAKGVSEEDARAFYKEYCS